MAAPRDCWDRRDSPAELDRDVGKVRRGRGHGVLVVVHLAWVQVKGGRMMAMTIWSRRRGDGRGKDGDDGRGWLGRGV